MPIYEYQCEACGNNLEALQKISAAPLLDCPECGEPALKKKISAAAFRLKGGGWYETDFKTGNKKKLADGACSAAPSGAGDKPSPDGSGESEKSESKKGESKRTAEPRARYGSGQPKQTEFRLCAVIIVALWEQPISMRQSPFVVGWIGAGIMAG